MENPELLGSPAPQAPRLASVPLKVSVAMATYNGEKHLAEQLQSLAEQTLLPCELVVTDDGSTDSTPAIVAAFAETAPFPVSFHSNAERLGYGSNFLRAASLCRGDLIAFCDQDDRWLPAKLERCAQAFEDDEVTVVVHSAETWNGETRLGRLFPFFPETVVTTPGITDPTSLTPGFALVFRSDLLQLINNDDRPGCLFGLGNRSIMAHDAWIWLLGTTTGKTIKLKDVLALYRQHGSNTVGAPGRQTLRRRLALATQDVNYTLLANFEKKFAEVLASIPDAAAPKYAAERRDLVQQFEHRAKLHMLRAAVYNRTASFFDRVRTFCSMLASGAYSPAETKNRVGPRAAVKDLSYGVSGLYKRLT